MLYLDMSADLEKLALFKTGPTNLSRKQVLAVMFAPAFLFCAFVACNFFSTQILGICGSVDALEGYKDRFGNDRCTIMVTTLIDSLRATRDGTCPNNLRIGDEAALSVRRGRLTHTLLAMHNSIVRRDGCSVVAPKFR